MSCGWLYDDWYLTHETGPFHPERPERLRAIFRAVREAGLMSKMTALKPHRASRELITLAHDPVHVRRVRTACLKRLAYIDSPDTPISPNSYTAALLAAGGVETAVDAVMAGQIANAFCAIRPPGHHAERDRAMGFCLFNNVAIGAEYVMQRYGLKRVAIVDFDVHHANATQHAFEDRDDVLVISLHQDPLTLFPGTGFERERGIGKGEGYTINIEMEPGSGNTIYERAFQKTVLPALGDYRPEFLFVSAGFDAARKDPLSEIWLTDQAFTDMSRHLCGAADQLCDGRLVSVLEGGYNLDTLCSGLLAHLTELIDAAD